MGQPPAPAQAPPPPSRPSRSPAASPRPTPTGPLRDPPTPGLAPPPPPYLRYTAAIVAVSLVLGLRLALPLSGPFVFRLFYPVVAAAAWYGGLGPGLLAAVLAAIAGNYFLTPPTGDLSTAPEDLVETALFLVFSTFIAWLIARARATRRAAEAAAHKAAERGERFRVTLAGIGDAVIATDETGRVTFMNAVAETLTGWKEDEARDRPLDEVFKIVNEHTRAPAENPVTRVLKEGVVTGLANQTLLIAKDGSERLIEDSAAPVRAAGPGDSQQAMLGAVLVFRDVTARRRAEEAARAADAQLRLALEAGRMGAWSWDIKSNRITWSDTLGRLHGLEPGTFGGTFDEFLQLVHPDDRAAFQETLQRSLQEATRQKGEAAYDAEFRMVRKDGAVRWMHSSGRVVPGADERPARIVGLRFDVTEQKAEEQRRQLLADAMHDFAAAQPDLDAVSTAVDRVLDRARAALSDTPEDRACMDELRRRANTALENARLFAAEHLARAEAEEATASRDRFLSIASHELRTPVTTIKGHAQMVLRAHTRGRLEGARLLDSLQNINAAADRLNFLVQDLLDVSRLRTGRLSLHLEEVEPGALVREVLSRHGSHLADGRRFSTKLAAGLPTIRADSHRIEQVLVNLIGNAAKYSERGGTVHVSASPENEGVRFEVRDQGIGLPPGEAEAIFEPFGRASNAQNVAGLGLGLYISRGIVEQHGGRIGAESPGVGRGTTVWFWLPKQASEEAQEEV